MIKKRTINVDVQPFLLAPDRKQYRAYIRDDGHHSELHPYGRSFKNAAAAVRDLQTRIELDAGIVIIIDRVFYKSTARSTELDISRFF